MPDQKDRKPDDSAQKPPPDDKPTTKQLPQRPDPRPPETMSEGEKKKRKTRLTDHTRKNPDTKQEGE